MVSHVIRARINHLLYVYFDIPIGITPAAPWHPFCRYKMKPLRYFIYKMKSYNPSPDPGCLQNGSLQGTLQNNDSTKTALQNESP